MSLKSLATKENQSKFMHLDANAKKIMRNVKVLYLLLRNLIEDERYE